MFVSTFSNRLLAMIVKRLTPALYIRESQQQEAWIRVPYQFTLDT